MSAFTAELSTGRDAPAAALLAPQNRSSTTPSALAAAAPALLQACVKMLQLTGGSQYWTGETQEALALMETALKGLRP